MNARAMGTAQERQLDWLLGEVLGNGAANRSSAAGMSRWLAAALALLAIGVAVGVAVLREVAPAQTQEPARDAEWTQCHGPGALAAVDGDVTALKCFDFDDAACAQLARFTKLERLDLSGMDVNDKGYAVSLKITDAGVRALGTLTNLRSLSLATCHEVHGEGLQALEALPRLEHLDLTYSGVESPALERLPRLPSLRSLVLSHCMNFHGRSLAAVATIPGLRRLELRACSTLAAADVVHLVKLKELRHLDLRDCQGRFRGQRMSVAGSHLQEEQPGPVEDGIGITDAVVEALATMPLESLLLGGSESLTDAIGDALAKMITLRVLDLSELPKTTGALLAKVPDGLEALALDHNPQLDAAAFASLPRLTGLKELGLSGLSQLDGATLKTLLADKRLTSLRLGGPTRRGKGDLRDPRRPLLQSSDAALLAEQPDLRSLDLANSSWVDRNAIAVVAKLPRLEELDLASHTRLLMAHDLEPLAASRSLRSLKFTWCEVDRNALPVLGPMRLREIDLYGTKLLSAHIREVAKAWPGCLVKMPDARLHRVP